MAHHAKRLARATRPYSASFLSAYHWSSSPSSRSPFLSVSSWRMRRRHWLGVSGSPKAAMSSPTSWASIAPERSSSKRANASQSRRASEAVTSTSSGTRGTGRPRRSRGTGSGRSYASLPVFSMTERRGTVVRTPAGPASGGGEGGGLPPEAEASGKAPLVRAEAPAEEPTGQPGMSSASERSDAESQPAMPPLYREGALLSTAIPLAPRALEAATPDVARGSTWSFPAVAGALPFCTALADSSSEEDRRRTARPWGCTLAPPCGFAAGASPPRASAAKPLKRRFATRSRGSREKVYANRKAHTAGPAMAATMSA
mmetsp:Transcript_9612/g.32594  ORF Transcript_9612/g.32594 Transcript_9612/m.32594 type:complete len:315 (-) Transcript_9612:47-991(-)